MGHSDIRSIQGLPAAFVTQINCFGSEYLKGDAGKDMAFHMHDNCEIDAHHVTTSSS